MGNVIGQRLPKLDAPDKATGRTVYGHDVRLPGMLHGRILYSRYPHARILRVDASRATKLPGVKAIVTPADNPKTKFGYGKDNTPLKGEVVRSLRDEVAAVAATDAGIAEEALSLIEVEYEPLPAVFDAADALKPDAPLIHPERGSNLFQRYNYFHGNLAAGERESEVVVEADYELPYVAHAAMETSVVVASFDHRGHLTLYSTTQIPFLLQRDLSEALGLEGSDIRIIQTAIGGAFGRGLDIYPYEPIAALLARKAGKPVRISFSRHEEFLAAPVRQPAKAHLRAGAKRDGLISFREVYALLDIGAYVSWGSVTPLVMMETTASLYRVPHVRFSADCVYTNNPITGAVRGYGNPQSTFFIETLMDRLAEETGIDPIEFRLKNATLPGEETAVGKMVAEVLGTSIESISVHNSDSDVKPWDVGVHASRTTFIAGNAAHQAALDARRQLFETAAELLSVTPDDLEARQGSIGTRSDGRSLPLEKVVRARHFREGGQIVVGEGWYDPPTQLVDKATYKGNISAAYGFGAQMAEVEVDLETGQVHVLRLVCANDVGRAINPMAVEGQIEGGAQMGLGYALTEELLIQDGRVLNPDLLDYRLFTAADMPAIETVIIETDDPGGPFGAKGVGEMGGTPTAAAIANAVYAAAGVRLTRLPMTPERVLQALQAESGREKA